MAHRASNRQPGIIRKVIADKEMSWGQATRKTAQIDAQCVLEAFVAEYGVEAAVRALDNQGFKGDAMLYLLKPLHEEAIHRRLMAQQSTSVASGGEDEAPPSDEEFERILDQLAEEGAAIHKRQGEPTLNLPITREEIYQDHP
jgi:hypothetical protein